ncbi:hypothetical protein [Mycobacterium sp. AZCC_0083]|uniref:hypothetical protein n=1 Tax=Mycobacterium sp. AZCC_0083 TaxID=2735882 RepID=UPI00161F2388|nr:hypothetical protein [Mycobacterium sp. AZCC_0083]MBB5167571.1 hypothetical protein [Mycobacterium sp. AZCC_0083]
MRADAVLAALGQEIKRQLRAGQIPEEMVTFSAPTSRGTRLTNGIPQWGKQARRVVVFTSRTQPPAETSQPLDDDPTRTSRGGVRADRSGVGG